MATIFSRFIDYKETCKWMQLNDLGCMNNADFEKEEKTINANIMLDLLPTCQKSGHVLIIFKMSYPQVLIDLHSNPQSVHSQLPTTWKASNTVGFSMCDFVLVQSYQFCTTLDLKLSFYRPLCYNSRPHCTLLEFLRVTSVILAGAHSYFLVLSFELYIFIFPEHLKPLQICGFSTFYCIVCIENHPFSLIIAFLIFSFMGLY